MKNTFKVMFFVSLALMVVFTAIMLVTLTSAENENNGSIGIIGGADGPTATFITRTLIFDSPMFWVIVLILVVFVASAIGWLVTKNK